MFTGIVEATGTVLHIEDLGGGRRITIGDRTVADGMRVGDSVAVAGACLTAVDVDPTGFTVELVPETLARTTLGALEEGAKVNLERAMPASGRFDGHIVQGHVDGVGTVRRLEPQGTGHRLSIRCDPGVLGYVVEKGSVTVDGVSLTVASVDDGGFEVALIPHTVAVTTLGALRPPARVNLEADILAKYVERLMESKS